MTRWASIPPKSLISMRVLSMTNPIKLKSRFGRKKNIHFIRRPGIVWIKSFRRETGAAVKIKEQDKTSSATVALLNNRGVICLLGPTAWPLSTSQLNSLSMHATIFASEASWLNEHIKKKIKSSVMRDADKSSWVGSALRIICISRLLRISGTLSIAESQPLPRTTRPIVLKLVCSSQRWWETTPKTSCSSLRMKISNRGTFQINWHRHNRTWRISKTARASQKIPRLSNISRAKGNILRRGSLRSSIGVSVRI